MIEKLSQDDLIVIHGDAPGGSGVPVFRRIDSTITEIVPVWGVLVEMGVRYMFEELSPALGQLPPKLFSDKQSAVAWLVEQINAHPPLVKKFRDALAVGRAEVHEAPADERGEWR